MVIKPNRNEGRHMQKFKDSEITPEEIFFNRRKFMASSAALLASPALLRADDLTPNKYEDITHYNNYYEFSTSKEEVASLVGDFKTSPWQVEIAGAFEKTGVFDLNDLIASLPKQNRTYRFRCVEGWSMVVPWNGFRLADLLNKFGVQSSAKYIAFETIARPEEMPGLAYQTLDWPYREGLRIDEAMHDLTLLATGIYDKDIPAQNGAPIRLITPWKYGFKSIKSIVKISAVDKEPYATWNKSNPSEYGFYANVNPDVDHPRWSQATERPLGGGLFAGRVDTKIFNGYDEVASLYTGMDLKKFF